MLPIEIAYERYLAGEITYEQYCRLHADPEDRKKNLRLATIQQDNDPRVPTRKSDQLKGSDAVGRELAEMDALRREGVQTAGSILTDPNAHHLSKASWHTAVADSTGGMVNSLKFKAIENL